MRYIQIYTFLLTYLLTNPGCARVPIVTRPGCNAKHAVITTLHLSSASSAGGATGQDRHRRGDRPNVRRTGADRRNS